MADTDVEQDQGTGIGAALRANRLRRGLTLDNIAETLRVRRHFLQAIEEGRYETLPGPTYARGFVRAYADLLGMHSGEAERQFKIETLGRKIGGDLHFPSPESERGVPKAAILFASVLLLGLAYGGWYLLSPPSEDHNAMTLAVPEQQAPTTAGDPTRSSIPVPKSPAPQQAARDPDTLPRQPEPAAQPAPAAGEQDAPAQARSEAPPPSAAPPPASAATPGGDASSGPPAGQGSSNDTGDRSSGASPMFEPPPASGEVAPEPAAESPAPPAAPAEEPAAPAESAAPGADDGIVLRATAPSWIELRDRNGRVVLSKVLEAGKMLPVDGTAGLSLVTGNAGGLEIILGKEVLPPLGRPGRVRRDIELDPAALRTMAER